MVRRPAFLRALPNLGPLLWKTSAAVAGGRADRMLMIVCIMCPVMSLVATLLFKEPSFGTWVHTWGCNMPMALCWQMLYCGPLARAIFRLLFRRGEKKAA